MSRARLRGSNGMQQVQLGRTGLKVSRLCLGMMSYGDPSWRNWILSEEQTLPFVRAAADAGITYFDTADVYSAGASEEVTGRTLLRSFRVEKTTSWPPRSACPWDRP